MTISTDKDIGVKDKNLLLGRDISFGIQQTLACFSTDFIDPYVSRQLQNHFGNPEHEVTHKHVWGAEIAGDLSAFFAYLFAKQLFRKPIDKVIAATERNFDGTFDRLGKRSIKKWAEEHNLTEDDERYQLKLKSYKHFQAENAVDSGIIATTATLNNVAVQRMLGNQQSLKVILGSKLVGAAATLSLMLGMRTALPTATKSLDDELSERYFSKVARAIKRAVGVKDEPVEAEPEIPMQTILSNAPLTEHTLSDDKRNAFITSLQRSYKNQPIEQFREEQKQVCKAFIMTLYPGGAYAQSLSAQHLVSLKRLLASHSHDIMPDEALKNSSLISIQSIVINRRDDMLARIHLLDDPAFLAELKTSLNKPPAPNAATLPEHKHEALIESLVQTKGSLGREPAVHIHANAMGQIIEHQALLECFKGNSVQILADELAKYMQGDSQKIAEDYSFDRAHAAQLVVEALALDGAIVTQAIHRSEAVRRKAPARKWTDNITPVAAREPSLALAI